MARLEHGCYRGFSDGLLFDFRIERDKAGGLACASGDVFRDNAFLASFVGSALSETEDGVSGAIEFRGHPELVSGDIFLHVDDRGLGSFRLGVDLEGGMKDAFAGKLERRGSYLRRLMIEVDGLEGLPPPPSYVAASGETISIERAFEAVGFDVDYVLNPFRGGAWENEQRRGFTMAELHVAMTERRSRVSPEGLRTHLFVTSHLAGPRNRGVLGIMYDFRADDLNRRPREGVALFYDHWRLSDPRLDEAARRRDYVFTAVHEIGHALNLLHSFEKARPAALSWMNYPDRYPRGHEAPRSHDGRREFWRSFADAFDEEELRHLRHATPREIRAGELPFGVYEDGAARPFGGSADPRRLTRLGANPLRGAPELALKVRALKSEYQLGEPVFASMDLRNTGTTTYEVPSALSPHEGHVRFWIRRPDGRVRAYRPPVTLCHQTERTPLPPGENIPGLEDFGVPLFLSADGPVFDEPGDYWVTAELVGIDGVRSTRSAPFRVTVRPPIPAVESLAHTLWDSPGVLQSLFLRHPLADRRDWDRVEDKLDELAALEKDGKVDLGGHTLGAYFHYIAGRGWMTPFTHPLTGKEMPADPEKALRRFAAAPVWLREGLPASMEQMVQEARESVEGDGRSLARVRRKEIPPSGFFASAGLRPGRRAAFIDVASWDLAILETRTDNFKSLDRVARFIREMRCDFWALRGLGPAALESLLRAVNGGSTAYDALPGDGLAALYRPDTTEVRPFDGGEEKALFCDVRVRQSDRSAVDLRCAIGAVADFSVSALLDRIESARGFFGGVDRLVLGDFGERAPLGARTHAARITVGDETIVWEAGEPREDLFVLPSDGKLTAPRGASKPELSPWPLAVGAVAPRLAKEAPPAPAVARFVTSPAGQDAG